MKVLIIEDSLAIQELLKEILENHGDTVETVDNFEKAVEYIDGQQYEFAILDTDMFDGNGLKLLDMLDEESPSKTRIVVLRAGDEAIPEDSQYVKGIIDKPFLTSDVTNILEDIRNMASDSIVPVKQRREHTIIKTRLAPEPCRTMSDMGLEFGRSYVLFQDTAKAVYEVASSFGQGGCEILTITAMREKAMKERFRGFDNEVISITYMLKGGKSEVYPLGTLIDKIADFVDRMERPVIVFDNLNQIINRNGMNTVLTMLHQIMTTDYKKNISIVISVNAREFSDKDKNILKSRFIYYSPIKEAKK